LGRGLGEKSERKKKPEEGKRDRDMGTIKSRKNPEDPEKLRRDASRLTRGGQNGQQRERKEGTFLKGQKRLNSREGEEDEEQDTRTLQETQ